MAAEAADYVLAPKLAGALMRFRIVAIVVGFALIVLVVAMVLRYGFGQHWAVATWGPIHGFLYLAYFFITLELSFRARWSPVGTLWVLLAGFVPIGSFYAERAVRTRVLVGQRL